MIAAATDELIDIDSAGTQIVQVHAVDRGITLVTVTHDPNVARRADRVIVLRDGRIVRRVLGREVSSLAELFEFDGVEDGNGTGSDAPADAAHAEPAP